MSSSPIQLSDAQLDSLLAAAAPLDVSARDAFLRDVASALADFPVIVGDSVLHRLVAEIQRRHFRPPEFGNGEPRRSGGKYS